VTLIVSTGRPRVPTIAPGTSVAEATQLLRAAELTVAQDDPSRRSHPTAPAGTVVGTSPPAGTEMNLGGPVALVVSSGPPPRRSYRDSSDQRSGHRDLGGSIADEIQRRLADALGGF